MSKFGKWLVFAGMNITVINSLLFNDNFIHMTGSYFAFVGIVASLRDKIKNNKYENILAIVKGEYTLLSFAIGMVLFGAKNYFALSLSSAFNATGLLIFGWLLLNEIEKDGKVVNYTENER
ncbi:hypothetical protein [Bacillus toyonensis]|uniref:hypothetical protein n=1 Tax=Bacillus toyonensis TaxID=155322 RepID=UPI002E1E97CB|nr:hypothetical protein [Bacillus toyonensis]